MDENPIQAPIQPPSLPKSSLKLPLTILLVAILGVAGYAGASYYLNLWPFEVATPVPTFTPRPSSAAKTEDTWKTYTSQEYGFEFRYPDDLVMIRDFGKEGLYSGFDFAVDTSIPTKDICLQGKENSEWSSHEGLPCTFYISVNDFKEKTLTDYVAKNMDIGSIEAFNGLNEEMSIGDNKWIIAGSPEGPGIGNWALFGLNKSGTKVITIWITNVFDIDTRKVSEKANQMLSTFKFIGGIDISTWKTYSNKQYGFSFKYPPNYYVKETTYFDSKEFAVEVKSPDTDRIAEGTTGEMSDAIYFVPRKHEEAPIKESDFSSEWINYLGKITVDGRVGFSWWADELQRKEIEFNNSDGTGFLIDGGLFNWGEDTRGMNPPTTVRTDIEPYDTIVSTLKFTP